MLKTKKLKIVVVFVVFVVNEDNDKDDKDLENNTAVREIDLQGKATLAEVSLWMAHHPSRYVLTGGS